MALTALMLLQQSRLRARFDAKAKSSCWTIRTVR
jgi:predicted RNA polymerase sigma factor